MEVALTLVFIFALAYGLIRLIAWAFRRDTEARKAEKQRMRDEEDAALQMFDELEAWRRGDRE